MYTLIWKIRGYLLAASLIETKSYIIVINLIFIFLLSLMPLISSALLKLTPIHKYSYHEEKEEDDNEEKVLQMISSKIDLLMYFSCSTFPLFTLDLLPFFSHSSSRTS